MKRNLLNKNGVDGLGIFDEFWWAIDNFGKTRKMMAGEKPEYFEISKKMEDDFLKSVMLLFNVESSRFEDFKKNFPKSKETWCKFFDQFGKPELGLNGERFTALVEDVRAKSKSWFEDMDKIIRISGLNVESTLHLSVGTVIVEIAEDMGMFICADTVESFKNDWINESVDIDKMINTYRKSESNRGIEP